MFNISKTPKIYFSVVIYLSLELTSQFAHDFCCGQSSRPHVFLPMAVNIVYSLFIVPLFFTQIVQPDISLHYCKFKEGSKCDTNIPIDQTDRILKIKDTYGLHMNLTCASTQAIHWVIHIPPVSAHISKS